MIDKIWKGLEGEKGIENGVIIISTTFIKARNEGGKEGKEQRGIKIVHTKTSYIFRKGKGM